MAGTYLFRSFGLQLHGVKPGHAVLSEPADVQGPVLMQIAAGILDRLGIKLDSAAAGAPADSPHLPRQAFLQTQGSPYRCRRRRKRAPWPLPC